MEEVKFINESGLEFTDISSEKYRKYRFSNGDVLTIFYPLWLHVSESGGHRVFSSDGKSYYIRACEGWFIEWMANTGCPNFVK